MSTNNPLFQRITELTTGDHDISTVEAQLWEEFGKTRACVVMDSTGFTRATRAKGIAYFLSLIAQMRVIVGQIMQDHEVLNQRAEADNVYGEFATVDQAVKACFATHKAIDEAKLMLDDDEQYGMCAGVGYGKVLLAGPEGVFGNEMNIASKLGEDTADRGETLVSETAFKEVSQPDQLTAQELSIALSGVSINYYSCYPKGD